MRIKIPIPEISLKAQGFVFCKVAYSMCDANLQMI
jgi:hypothetical protein